jgi:ubiquinone biosynthesis protein UbiJ
MLDLAALAALNHLLADAPWARRHLARFAGRRARLLAPPLELEFRIGADGSFESLGCGAPDVEIVLPPGAALAALQGREALLREAQVSGSADFAEALSFVLRNLEWDAEEDLARLIGDIPAHRLARAARRFAAEQREAAQRLAENLGEYLAYERPWAVGRAELGNFAAAAETLHGETERLEQRISALEGRKPA